MTEAQRKEIEAATWRALSAAGIPPVTITTEDRLRGAMLSAVEMLERGFIKGAHEVLTEALRLP